MDQIQKLTGRQISWLTAAILTTCGMLSFPRSVMFIADMDGWLSQILPIFYSLLVASIFAYFTAQFPGKHIFQIIYDVLGKKTGAVINLLLLLYFWMLMARDVRALSSFLSSTLLLLTPESITIFMFLLVVMYYAKTSIEVTARVNDMLFPVFLLVTIILPLLLTNEISIFRMEPILTRGVGAITSANLISLGPFGDLFILGAFLHTLSIPKQMHAALRHGILLAGFTLTLLFLLSIIVLGAFISARTTFPSFTLVRQIHITDFLDRVEIVIFSLWFPVIIIKLSALFIAMLIGIASFTKNHDYRLYNRPLTAFVLITSLAAFKNESTVFLFGCYAAMILTLFTQVPLLSLLFALTQWKKRKGTLPPQHQINIRIMTSEQASPLLEKLSDKTLMWTTNGLLGGAFLFMVIGMIFANHYAIVGVIGGIGYFLCIMIATIVSSLELRKSNRFMANPVKDTKGKETS